MRHTHLVVPQPKRPHLQRLVPVKNVLSTTADKVTLDCTAEEFAHMREFVIRTYRQVEIPRYSGSPAAPYYKPEVETLPVNVVRVPEGQVAIHPGVAVHAIDGKVGSVDELLEDKDGGQITHFVMRQSHIWGSKDVIMPVTMVQYADDKAVHLKTDKQTLSEWLAVPTSGVRDVTDLELVIVTFDRIGAADEALDRLATQEGGRFHNAAVLVRDQAGKASIHEVQDVSKQHGAVFGAITGGLIGMLAGPGGGIVGAVTGAITGRAAAKRIDMGFPDAYLQKLQDGLAVNTSALVLLVDRDQVPPLSAAMVGHSSQFIQHSLTEEIVEQLPRGDFAEENSA
jgi:uncharacterized membrane protein